MKRLALLALSALSFPAFSLANPAVGNGNYSTYKALFTANGVGTIPANMSVCDFVVEGGGQSGAGGGTVAVSGSGGGSGATATKYFKYGIPVSQLPQLSYTVTIGAGGAAAAAGAVGNPGATTIIAFGNLTIRGFGATGTAPSAGVSGALSTGGVSGGLGGSIPTQACGGSTVSLNLNSINVSGAGSSALGVPGNLCAVRLGPGPGGAGGGLNAGVAQAGQVGGNSQNDITGSAADPVITYGFCAGGTPGGATGGGNGPAGNSAGGNSAQNPLFWPLGADGCGGAGGGGNALGAGGAGGAGVQPGGGGGGGGSGTGGGGAGGKGGDGEAFLSCK